MDTKTRRRENLRALVNTRFGGNQERTAEALQIKPSQLNRWLSKTTKDPRAITEDSARRIEELLGLPAGALDKEADPEKYDEAAASPTAHRAAQPSGVYSLPVDGLLKRLAEAEAALPNFDLLAAAIDGLISYAFASSRAQSRDKPAAEDDSPQTQPPKSQPTGLRGSQFSSRAMIEKHHAGQAKTKKSK